MKMPVRSCITVLATIALLFSTSLAQSRPAIRIDGSSDNSVQESFSRMMKSLDQEGQVKLLSAIVQLNMAGVSSAQEMLADPALHSPGPVRIKSRINRLSSAEIIALAARTSDVRVVVAGQEPGVPGEFLTPLAAGQPSHGLTSTQWRFVWNTNGFIKQQTLRFEPDGVLVTEPPSTAGASSWEQSGNEVRVLINDRYAVSRGTFVDADHLQGSGGNKMGSTWTWTAERR